MATTLFESAPINRSGTSPQITDILLLLNYMFALFACHSPTLVRADSAPAFAGINYGGNPLWLRRWIPAFAGLTLLWW